MANQRERQAAALQLARGATALLERTRLNVRVVCQAIHAKVPRHMLVDMIDYLEPTLVLVGSRGLTRLKGCVGLGPLRGGSSSIVVRGADEGESARTACSSDRRPTTSSRNPRHQSWRVALSLPPPPLLLTPLMSPLPRARHKKKKKKKQVTRRPLRVSRTVHRKLASLDRTARTSLADATIDKESHAQAVEDPGEKATEGEDVKERVGEMRVGHGEGEGEGEGKAGGVGQGLGRVVSTEGSA